MNAQRQANQLLRSSLATMNRQMSLSPRLTPAQWAKTHFQYYQEVQKFGALMLNELLANERKGDFLKWKPRYQEGLDYIDEHVRKLDLALLVKDRKSVTEHCADIANIVLAVHRAHGLREIHGRSKRNKATA